MDRVILFDGIYHLCNGAMNFVMKQDKKKIFHFAALQSAAGQQWSGKKEQRIISAPKVKERITGTMIV